MVAARLGRLALFAAVLLCLATTAFALATPQRNGWVTDDAGILDADTANSLATRLVDLQRQTGAEVVVVTLKSLEGVSIETWGEVLGETWGVGRNGGKDRGVLLIVAPNDRKMRIAVGYGLSNRLTDSMAAAIVSDQILPFNDEYTRLNGVKAGIESIAAQLGGGAVPINIEETNARPIQGYRPTFWEWFRNRYTPSHDTMVIAITVAVALVILIVATLRDGSGNRNWGRRRSDYWDDDDSSSSWGSHSSSSGSSWGGSSSSSSSSRGGGSFRGGATGSW